jgi:hypothetical protein
LICVGGGRTIGARNGSKESANDTALDSRPRLVVRIGAELNEGVTKEGANGMTHPRNCVMMRHGMRHPFPKKPATGPDDLPFQKRGHRRALDAIDGSCGHRSRSARNPRPDALFYLVWEANPRCRCEGWRTELLMASQLWKVSRQNAVKIAVNFRAEFARFEAQRLADEGHSWLLEMVPWTAAS